MNNAATEADKTNADDSVKDAPVFSPVGLSLPNSAKIIADGVAKITPNGRLVVDMENLQQCDSAAICLLIELLRNGYKQNCSIEIRNISEQLKKLMNLYRLTDLLMPKNPKTKKATA